ncbi:cytochrome P450 family protein [Lepidopterella palustris CBS 459.81]|uniref:Cytochrome P450 family protein n=1 Tax=Lepidopterella palustris CBS 459.81 TaxID=1314670 RepID=A0A8E2JBM3_9PEZI|nr:cytochrome P450 family protein [Lepidopterella palustris CBS 459.81]
MALLSSAAFSFGALAILIYIGVSRFINWRRLRHIPGPPLAGWTDLWLLRYVVPGKLCTKLFDVCSEHGPLARIGPNWVVCGDPAEIQRIWGIRSGFSRAPWYKATRLNPEEDNVLTMLDTKGHHRLRALLVPAYAGKGMDNQERLVDEQIEKLLSLIDRKYLSTSATLRPCNLGRVMQYLTQDLITTIGFGKAAGYLDADEDLLGVLETCEALLPAGHIIMFLPTVRQLLESRFLRPFLPKPTGDRGIGGLLGLIKSHVDTRYGPSKVRNNDMLQMFVDSGLRRSQVEAEALVTLFGGTDSTSTALRMTIFFLSTNLPAYRNLQAEIDAAIVSASRPIISDEHVKRLPYLQACIREGMRLWPPSMALLPKVSSSDQVICGANVPAGTNVGWAALKIMKDPQVFGENAQVFEPGRWIDAEPEKLKQMEGVYGLVFATGTGWECLGKKLAYVELGKVLFELFLRYDFAMVDSVHPFQWVNHGFTIHRGMNVKITRRTK